MKPIQDLTPADIISYFKGLDRKTWIRIGTAGVIIILVCVFIVGPAWFKRGLVRSQVALVQTQLRTVENLRIRKPEMMKQKQDYRKFVSDVKNRLYHPRDASLLLGEISRMANECQIKIIASRPEASKTNFPDRFKELYKANRYEFAVEGGYHQLGKFVSKIESNSKILRIQLFDIQPREDLPGSHIAEISLSVVSKIGEVR